MVERSRNDRQIKLSPGEEYIGRMPQADIRMGRTVVEVVSRELLTGVWDDRISPNVAGIVRLDDEYSKGEGYAGLWPNQPLVLGREDYPSRLGDLASDAAISRRHAEVGMRPNGELWVRDLHSMNGTLILPRGISQEKQGSREKQMTTDFATYGSTLAKEGSPKNADAYFISSDAVGVFDGVGSKFGSDYASSHVAAVVRRKLDNLPSDAPRNLASLGLQQALLDAKSSLADTFPDTKTTATVAKVFYDQEAGQHYAVVASVGDSRAYIVRDGHLNHVTLDDGIILHASKQEGLDSQTTMANVVRESDMSDAQRAAFYNRNVILNCVRGDDEPMSISIEIIDVKPGDQLLLTTDGIHDNLTDAEISRSLGGGQRSVDTLIRAARVRSADYSHLRAKPDDMTAAVLEIN